MFLVPMMKWLRHDRDATDDGDASDCLEKILTTVGVFVYGSMM